MFNVPRCFYIEDFPYAMLEEIKDGNVTSNKYNSSILEPKTPNTVVVFSNKAPDRRKMSKDRWTHYDIEEEYLYTLYGSKVE